MRTTLTILTLALSLAGCSNPAPLATTPVQATSGGGSETGAVATKPKERAIRLGEKDSLIFDAYLDNPILADQKYTGKTLEIIVFGVLDKDDAGYLIGESATGQATSSSGYNVIYRLSEDGAKTAAKMKPKEHALLRGICKGGKKNPAAWRGLTVTFVDCDIVAHGAWPLKWPDEN